MLHKGFSQGDRVKGVDVDGDGESGEVAHGAKIVFGTVVGGNCARLPGIDMNDRKWGGYGPGVDEFTAFPNGRVG